MQEQILPSWVCTNGVTNAAIPAMDIAEVRATNLRRLIKEKFGTNSAFAAATGVKESYVPRWYSKNSEHHRNMNSVTARKIEKAVGKPLGWLDTPVRNDMPPAPAALPYGRIDVAILTRVVRLAERVQRQRGQDMSAENKAAWIAAAYDEFSKGEHQTDQEKILRILKSVTEQ